MNPATTPLDQARRAVQTQRRVAAAGALLAMIAVALSALIAHKSGLTAEARTPAMNAAMMLLLHGGLASAIALQAVTANDRRALMLMLASAVLFSGSVIAGALVNTPTTLAPLGGAGLMLAWLWLAIARMVR